MGPQRQHPTWTRRHRTFHGYRSALPVIGHVVAIPMSPRYSTPVTARTYYACQDAGSCWCGHQHCDEGQMALVNTLVWASEEESVMGPPPCHGFSFFLSFSFCHPFYSSDYFLLMSSLCSPLCIRHHHHHMHSICNYATSSLFPICSPLFIVS